jgi:hypothetical protein
LAASRNCPAFCTSIAACYRRALCLTCKTPRQYATPRRGRPTPAWHEFCRSGPNAAGVLMSGTANAAK